MKIKKYTTVSIEKKVSEEVTKYCSERNLLKCAFISDVLMKAITKKKEEEK